MNKALKRAVLPAIFLVSSHFSAAATPGAYLGGGAGYSSVEEISDTVNQSDGGLAGRVFVGYNFNHYLGIEANYARLADTNFSFPQYRNVFINLDLSAVSVVGKLYLPVSVDNRLNLYAALGIAQMYSHFDGKFQSRTFLDDSDDGLVGTAGLGISYDLNRHWTTMAEFSAYDDKDVSDSHLGFPQSTLATISLAYKF